ncbi:DUF488 domain-containing protein [Methylophaga sulfidovorans]|uniref:Uncharacterized conserved protein YeaO, DUF488 family n=1 Tax=Methylophaga sulfidovorans TaxID=45496 RepID=A0A1I4C3K5_9GAMM|nr:DUF488 family protein [Methylophaga sulfidovorans]SFK75363.1 Uncharacterized conserved protein YeaO, DUF488 family [Methylophaga sulfidovorans]
MNIKLHRIYESDVPTGYRVLVDRLWPRGVSKEDANLDAHWKELTPSDELRKWFDHDPDKWNSFRKQYLSELSENKQTAKDYLAEVTQKNVVLLYAAKDKQHSHAYILKEYLEKLG